MEESGTISIEAAAKRLGIGRDLAYSLAREGKLPGGMVLGRLRRVSRVQLEDFLAGKNEPAVVAVEA